MYAARMSSSRRNTLHRSSKIAAYDDQTNPIELRASSSIDRLTHAYLVVSTFLVLVYRSAVSELCTGCLNIASRVVLEVLCRLPDFDHISLPVHSMYLGHTQA